MADLIDRDALEPFYESTTDPMNTYADMRFIRAEHIENAPAVNRWIPCSERLPEKDTPVLICGGGGHRVTAYYDAVKGVFRLTESEDLFYKTSAVTHWMPLPEPPKE